jgi:molecular chaperone DnaK
VPQVEVSFDIDANGILNVKATDKATSREQKITITASSGLNKEEVEKMKKDAELHAEEDKKKKEAIEIKNIAETLIYTTEKMIKDNAAKIKDEDRKVLEEKIEAVKKVKDGADAEAIKKATEELSQAAQKVGAEMYKQAEPPKTGDTTKPEEPKKDDNVQDGKFEEKK